jgi:hypothetical protein
MGFVDGRSAGLLLEWLGISWSSNAAMRCDEYDDCECDD